MIKNKKFYWFIFATFIFLPTSFAFAQVLQNPLKGEYSTIPGFLKAILNIVIDISVPIIVLMIVYSGFLFVKAQGNPEALATARKAIMWTIVGAAVILGASVISYSIKGTVDELQRGAVHNAYIVELA